MKVAIFDAHNYEKDVFKNENREFHHELIFMECRLTSESAALAKGVDAVCSFVNDKLTEQTLIKLKENGVRIVALRSAGFNHVDLSAAEKLNIPVVRVPEYSPYAVAEHAVALMLTLNRKIHKAHARIRELNFSLEGLVGFDMHGKTVGVIGTGKIGQALVKILKGFGCRILAYDLKEDSELIDLYQVKYVDIPTLCRESDIVSLHVPLTPETRHMINMETFALMKPSCLLINTGRGGLIETKALIEALKKHQIGGAGLDVYEEEEEVFFSDHSTEGISDDVLARLLTFPNVVVTSHQAFLTKEALSNIAHTTLISLSEFESGKKLTYQVKRSP